MLRKRDKSENQSKTLVKEHILPGMCYGCGTCSGICPNDAVVMRLDRKKGIYLPKIDEMKCNGCGICTQVCPVSYTHLTLPTKA